MSATRTTTRRGSKSTMAVMPLASLPLGDLGATIKNAIVDFLSDVLEALLSNLIGFFSDIIKELLFFPRPSTVSGLEMVQQKATLVFTGLLLIGWLVFFLNLQVFPSKTKSDPYRLLERSLAGIVMVIAGPMMLDYAVVLTSSIGKFFYPSDLGGDIASIVTSNPRGSLIAIALLYAVGTTLIVIVAGFFVVLSLRMFLVYVLFALLPLFAAFWVFDVGVGKYTKQTADMFFKAAAMVLVAGILISAVLQVGVAISDTGASAFGGDEASGFDKDSTNSVEHTNDDGDTVTCFKPLKFGNLCVLSWSKLFAFIGIGGAMTVSTTVAMLGVGSLMGGGGMGSVAAGAAGGLAAGAVGKAKSAVGGGGGGGGGGQQAGADELGSAGAGGGTAPSPQFNAVTDGGGGRSAGGTAGSRGGAGGSGTPSASLGGGTAGGGASTVSTGRTGGTGRAQGGQTRGGQAQGGQQDKSLLDKTADAADTGSKIGGIVGKVDPTMGAAVTAAAGAYKFHQEGGFSDVKNATVDAGKTLGSKAADVKNSLNVSNPASGHRDKGGDESGIGDQSNSQLDYQ